MPQAPRSGSATTAPSCALPVTLGTEEGATCPAFLPPEGLSLDAHHSASSSISSKGKVVTQAIISSHQGMTREFLEGKLKQLGAACAPSRALNVIVLMAVQ